MKKPHYVYSYGLPFSREMSLTLDSLKARVENGKASMILIDGGIGEGKTTLGVEIADYLQGQAIDLKRGLQLAMGGAEFTVKLRRCYEENLLVLIYDEAGDFNRRGSLTAFNSSLNRVFETFRAFKVIVILCLPNFSVLDNSLFEKGIPRALFHCYGRTNSCGHISLYDLEKMYYLKYYMSKTINKIKVYSRVIPNFRGHFLNLYPERAQQLHDLTIKGKLDILAKTQADKEGLLTSRQIAEKMNLNIKSVYAYLQKIGAKPVRKDGKLRVLYSLDTIEKIQDYRMKGGITTPLSVEQEREQRAEEESEEGAEDGEL
jgi:hypothetical protein